MRSFLAIFYFAHFRRRRFKVFLCFSYAILPTNYYHYTLILQRALTSLLFFLFLFCFNTRLCIIASYAQADNYLVQVKSEVTYNSHAEILVQKNHRSHAEMPDELLKYMAEETGL